MSDPCHCHRVHQLVGNDSDQFIRTARCGWCVDGLIRDKNETVRDNQKLLAEVERMRAGLTRIRKAVENGEEWHKLDAGSLHLMVADALGE